MSVWNNMLFFFLSWKMLLPSLSVSNLINDAVVNWLRNIGRGQYGTGECPSSLAGLLSQSLQNKTKLQEIYGSSLPQVTSYWPDTLQAWVFPQSSACGICREWSFDWTAFPPGTSLSGIIIIPPKLHTHILFIYHWHNIGSIVK